MILQYLWVETYLKKELKIDGFFLFENHVKITTIYAKQI